MDWSVCSYFVQLGLNDEDVKSGDIFQKIVTFFYSVILQIPSRSYTVQCDAVKLQGRNHETSHSPLWMSVCCICKVTNVTHAQSLFFHHASCLFFIRSSQSCAARHMLFGSRFFLYWVLITVNIAQYREKVAVSVCMNFEVIRYCTVCTGHHWHVLWRLDSYGMVCVSKITGRDLEDLCLIWLGWVNRLLRWRPHWHSGCT